MISFSRCLLTVSTGRLNRNNVKCSRYTKDVRDVLICQNTCKR